MAKSWDISFGPTYTPEEMIELGIFEGTYIRAIKGLPGSWYSKPKVLKKGQRPDPKLNKFGVKSRLNLNQWQAKGWIKTDPNGWFEWYCKYYLGRRLGDEDIAQIKRWRSFVARHQAQVVNSGKLKDESTRLKQRQGLLQWGWDSTVPFNESTIESNAKRLARKTGSTISEVSEESMRGLSQW